MQRGIVPLVLTLAWALAGIATCPAAPATTAAGAPQAGVSPPPPVEYWADNQPRALQPAKPAPAGAKLVALKDLPLVLKEPAAVSFGGSTYSLDGEGLYRFREKGKVVRQTILHRGDAWRLAGHLSRLYVYGRRHQYDGIEKITERARNGEPVSLQCGIVSLFLITHLSEHGIPTRGVQGITARPWNGYDDSHVLTEILDPVEKRWVVFDPTLGARYRKDGRWLNLLELTQLYRAGGRAEIEFVNGSSKVDPLTNYEAIYGGFNDFAKDKKKLADYVSHFKRELNGDAEAIHTWYARVMQIPLVRNSFVPASDAEEAAVRTNPGYKGLERLTPEQLRERLYPEG